MITNLNGVELDSGTMEEYCDVLRSTNEGDAISIRVLRFDTEEEMEGELFSDKTLETTYSFASELRGPGRTRNGRGHPLPTSTYPSRTPPGGSQPRSPAPGPTWTAPNRTSSDSAHPSPP
ncbi:MAG: hypothetical protein M5U19_06175 [Microthrixaceae bacterium]|nr:hypothetical protein [Microthrixaceae bacterium]